MSAPARDHTDAATTGARVVTLAERPDLAPAIPGVLISRWPMFMLAGHPGHDADLTAVAGANPDHQVLLIDDSDALLGVGLSVPIEWDGTVAGLPAGWDGAVTAAAQRLERGAAPTAVCALSITLTPAATGRGLAGQLIDGMKRSAARAGLDVLIAPVRPVLKSRYPLMPMERYIAWRTETGEAFDPWLRLHLAVGGEVLAVAEPSMTITGTAAEWSEWVGLPLGGSGEYVIPGGLVPLEVDREADLAVYREPNVWMVHATAA